MTSESMARALLLLEHERPEEALPLIERAIGDDPDDGESHAWLAICLARLKRTEPALSAARQAIHLEPDSAFCHFALAVILDQQDKTREAHLAILEAIQLHPYEPSFFALQASLFCQQHKWRQAREAAEKGLAIEPAHTDCINLRATALRELGETDDAAEALHGALSDRPDDPMTHANLGWNYLHKRQPREALESFREALRLNPNLTTARAGIVEALKARNPIYRVMLRFFLWLGHFSPSVQFALIIGAVVGMQFLQQIGASHPALAPWIGVIGMLYLLFVFATWMASPFFDLVLFIDPIGRYALSRQQKRTALWLGLTLIVCGGVALWLALVVVLGGGGLKSILVVVLPFLLTFPVLTAARARPGGARLFAVVYSLAMATFLGLTIVGRPGAMRVFIWGCVLWTWISNLVPRDYSFD